MPRANPSRPVAETRGEARRRHAASARKCIARLYGCGLIRYTMSGFVYSSWNQRIECVLKERAMNECESMLNEEKKEDGEEIEQGSRQSRMFQVAMLFIVCTRS